jgi:hypothetical protein
VCSSWTELRLDRPARTSAGRTRSSRQVPLSHKFKQKSIEKGFLFRRGSIETLDARISCDLSSVILYSKADAALSSSHQTRRKEESATV